MPNLSYRSNEKELIDDLELDNDALRQNLEELALINKYLGGNQVTVSGLSKLIANTNSPITNHQSQLNIADLGCGGGDMLVVMANWAKRKGINAEFIGIDANDFMIDFAKKRTANYENINYLHQNIFSEAFKEKSFDIITMTLFCHHFDDESLVKIFTQFKKQSRIGIVINDIHRHWFAYHSIAWITKLFLKSYLVKNDAKLSVWRAFRRDDLEKIIQQAGFTKYSIRWKWAFRWEVVLEV
ncbi:ubiquinone/menaquinone biosynthesis C-methylase UbiE [Arcicella aurantiaca]|uniref:Ubiquinone/menaquinone biosynthesis C-methylase UbiE n=1 Tax=Arcicella aurantiaca TaxID=591202 RepID=A0A316EBW2_9BACT|nr:methyltransferase domain-containing protein [Arcicella aurantiaca]PWK26263.1 ubiquinone/menaquinone biosynthesis C-methylase UbiE [Arcicella aurantiaca]